MSNKFSYDGAFNDSFNDAFADEKNYERYHTPEEALKFLFGYDSFREGQKEVTDSILSGRDALAVMPTGAGKSVCYQIHAMLLPGITLVISPLKRTKLQEDLHMSKQKNYDVVTENEIGYLKAGDYHIPAIELKPIEMNRLGKYGRMRRMFLQEYNPILFNDLVLTEQLFPHLYKVQDIAEKRVEVIMEGLLEKNPVPEKKTDAMAWTRHMNMLKAVA